MIFRCYHEMSSISPENILQLIFGSKFFQVVYFLFHTIFTIDFNGFNPFPSVGFIASPCLLMNLKDMDYTAPMVNRLKYKKANTAKNYKGNACNLKLKALENRQFDFVREENAFKKLIVMLEQNAE